MKKGSGNGVKTSSGAVVQLRTKFAVEEKLEPFYTGGQVQISSDGAHMFCQCESAVKILQLEKLTVVQSLEEKEDSVTSLAVSPNNASVVIGWRSLLLKQYQWQTSSTPLRQWKGHTGPVLCMDFDATSTLLATGSSDSSIKVWDCIQNYCTHNLKGSFGVVSLVKFHPSIKELKLFSCSADYNVRVWNLTTSKCMQVLSGHVSPVTSLAFSSDGTTLVSGGRDQVLLCWDYIAGSTKKTLPVFESVEAVVTLPTGTVEVPSRADRKNRAFGSKEELYVATAGSRGQIRIWDVYRGVVVHSLQSLHHGDEQTSNEENSSMTSYTGLKYCSALRSLFGVTFDHNIVVYDTETLTKCKHLAGHLDEVLDLKYMRSDVHDCDLVAIATNTNAVTILDQTSGHCEVLEAHEDVVLSLSCSSDGRILVSSSKDNTIRVWLKQSAVMGFKCVAVGHGHTLSVGAVACSKLNSSFAVSGSMDCTVKLWDLSLAVKWNEIAPTQLTAVYTQVAHKKDINSLDISPNDKLFVSGSQDKTAKLWDLTSGDLLGTLKGHRRGVWSVQFSPVDKCVITSSGDGTVKLWSVTDFNCLKTFEGHSNSVLKAIFITKGMQIVSAGNDGLLKVWTIKNGLCAATLDKHTDRVWALAAIGDGDTLLSGGADSLVCQWNDITEQVKAEDNCALDELIIKEQQLSNFVHQKEYKRAVDLALTLERPHKVLSILSEMLEEGGISGNKLFQDTISSLRKDQTILNVVLQTYPQQELQSIGNLKELVDGLVAYTERHFQRLSRLQQLSSFVEYTWQRMKLTEHVTAPNPSFPHLSPAMIESQQPSTSDLHLEKQEKGDEECHEEECHMDQEDEEEISLITEMEQKSKEEAPMFKKKKVHALSQRKLLRSRKRKDHVRVASAKRTVHRIHRMSKGKSLPV